MSTLTTPEKSAQPRLAPVFLQRLGLFDSTMLVAGTMIGSGIFIVSADIARDVGTGGWLMAVWVVTGIMTIFGALSYAELAAMIPQAGGQYIFLREAYSPLWGFLYGWTCFLIIQTGSIAAVAVAFAKFLGVLVPQLGTDVTAGAWPVLQIRLDNLTADFFVPGMDQAKRWLTRSEYTFTVSAGQVVAVAVVVFLTLLNSRGIREGKWVQNIFTVAKILALVVLIVVGLTLAKSPQAVTENTSDLWQGISGTASYDKARTDLPAFLRNLSWVGGLVIVMVFGGSMVGSLFSADAWNNITFTAGEIINPRRNLPLSLAFGTGLVILLYLLANVAYLAALPVRGDEGAAVRLEAEAARLRDVDPEVSRAKLAEAAFQRGIDHSRDDRVGTAVLERVSPVFGVVLMAAAIMVSTFGCVNGMTLMGARLYYAMARDGLFFQAVGQLSRRGVPVAGLLLQGLWSILLIFSGSYNELLDYVMFAVLLFYVLTVNGLFILRRKMPDAERPYKAFGYPVIPAVYVVLCAVIMLDLLVVKPKYTWPGLGIVVAGIPVYYLWRWSGQHLAAPAS